MNYKKIVTYKDGYRITTFKFYNIFTGWNVYEIKEPFWFNPYFSYED